jgi:hypothetical protein
MAQDMTPRRATRQEKDAFRAGVSDSLAGRPPLYGSHDPASLAAYEHGYRTGLASLHEQSATAGSPLRQSWGSVFTGGYSARRGAPAARGTFDGLLSTLRDFGPRAS